MADGCEGWHIWSDNWRLIIGGQRRCWARVSSKNEVRRETRWLLVFPKRGGGVEEREVWEAGGGRRRHLPRLGFSFSLFAFHIRPSPFALRRSRSLIIIAFYSKAIWKIKSGFSGRHTGQFLFRFNENLQNLWTITALKGILEIFTLQVMISKEMKLQLPEQQVEVAPWFGWDISSETMSFLSSDIFVKLSQQL
jgi:hypothetical protein